jgi:long-chain acyl-CoA synthetase
MARDSLLDFFEDISRTDDIFIVHDDGYRVRRATYRQVAEAARAFGQKLIDAGVAPGDKVVIWSENRTEWVVALWGTLLVRAVLVPVDFRASADLLARVSGIVRARLVLVGDEVDVPASVTGQVWKLAEVIVIDDAVAGAGGPAKEAAAATPWRPAGSPEGASLAEIIFTSGATSEPKGVTITHRNVLANMIPIEREIGKYRRYVKLVHPLRFLNLLPLSHMFGQSMATFVPPMLAGTVVFSHGYSPVEILRQIKTRRISVLVSVPKVLDVLRDHVQRVHPHTADPDPLVGRHWLWRWWHYRDVRRMFGWKFWCMVCGAAPLDPELEAFWRKLGFLVVQGYGLTETAPIVTLNHPLRASRGTVGTPIGGVKVKIAEDGEILVQGENVTQGYYRPEGTDDLVAAEANAAFRDGWFHTGDIGEIDANGRLLIKGRKKEMIVTPQGLNVFPEDVERALLQQPGVKDAAVVGLKVDGEERIHAVLVLDDRAEVDAIVRGANAGLEDHQRVWSTSIWTNGPLPRTEGTQKLKRKELQRWASGEVPAAGRGARGGTSLADIIGRHVAGRTLEPDTTLEELGLSSLDRVELMMELEEAFHTTLDESMLTGSRSLRELEALLTGAGAGPALAAGAIAAPGGEAGGPAATRPAAVDTTITFPSWNRSKPAWLLRRISLPTWILPLGYLYMDLKVEGLQHLAGLKGPVLFAANHQSHMDTPAIMLALPARFRYRLAVAMAKEFFGAHFYPAGRPFGQRLKGTTLYLLSCQFFNAFPLPQREAGTRQTLRYVGEVAGDGYSVLIFPEGRRTENGLIDRFLPGVGMIGARLGLPVVPVRIDGLDAVLGKSMKWPVRGPVRVAFGAPIQLTGDDYAALAKQVEEAVRELAPGDQTPGGRTRAFQPSSLP